jgi:hypothetical protein
LQILNYSNKKHLILKQVRYISQQRPSTFVGGFCERNWVKILPSRDSFASNYQVIVRTMMDVSFWKDTKTASHNTTILDNIAGSIFIIKHSLSLPGYGLIVSYSNEYVNGTVSVKMIVKPSHLINSEM